MKYWFHNLGVLDEGKTLEIVLDHAAYVRVMDQENYNEYKHRRAYKSHSKYVTSSPYVVKTPRASHWYVVVDLEGKPGVINSVVRISQSGGARTGEAVAQLPEVGNVEE